MTSGWRVETTQPAIPVPDGIRIPTRCSSPSPETASKTSSSVFSSSRKIDDALAEKIPRAVSTIDCSSARCASSAPMTPAATAARRSELAIGTSHVPRGQVEHALELERRQLRVLREDERTDAGHVRRSEAIPGAAQRRAAEPGDVDVDAAREELHRRIRVVEELLALVELVAADRDDGRELPRIALDRHVVRRRHEHGALEVGAVREVVQDGGEVALGRGEAHVDEVVPLLDRPAEARQQDLAAAGVAGAEHAHAVKLAVGGERADDPGTGGPVPAQVALGVLLDGRVPLGVDRDGVGPLQFADER